MFTKEAIQGRVETLEGALPAFTGDNEVDSATIGEAIDQAREHYELEFPREITEDEVGDSGNYYALTSLANWENDFSVILGLDYDSGNRVSNDERPQWLFQEDGDWDYYRDASTRYIRFITRTPTSSVTFRITYTARHVLNSVTSTIRNTHESSIVYLSISKLCSIISIKTEKALDPPGGAQFISMRNKSSGFQTLAREYFSMYLQEIGGVDGVHPVGVTKEYDLKPLGVGGSYLFHSGAFR